MPPARGGAVLARTLGLASTRRALAASLCAVVALALVLYVPTLRFGLSYFDDDVLVLAPRAAAEAETPWRALGKSYFAGAERDHAYYRPLVSASFALDALTSGSEPFGYRVTNLVVHVASASLLALLLLDLGYSLGTALFGALVFVAHPALAGAVAWIPGRDDSGLALFALAAWLAWRRALRNGRWWERVLHGVGFFLALACKEAAIAVPFLFVLDARVLGAHRLRGILRPWTLAAWGVPLAVYAALRLAVLGPGLGLGGVSLAGFARGLPALVAGFGELALPLSPRFLGVPEDLPLAFGGVSLALFAAALAWSGARPRRLLFGLAGYALLSLPSLPAASQLLLESRLYLAAVPLVVAVCELGERGRLPASARPMLAAFLVTLLAFGTHAHAADFRDRMALSRAAVKASPHSSLARRNLGLAYQLAGNPARAREEYVASLAVNPYEPLVHNNLAVMLMAEGRLPEAEAELEAELGAHPASTEARRNLSLVRAARAGQAPAPDASP